MFKVAKAVFYFFAAVALAIPAAIHSAYTWAFSKPSEQAPLPVNAPADRGWWPFRSK